MSTKTPAQWSIEENPSLDITEITAHDEYAPYVATVHHCRPDYEDNAFMIVHQHNTYPALVEALKHILVMADDAYLQGHPEWGAMVSEARTVVAQAEGGQP